MAPKKLSIAHLFQARTVVGIALSKDGAKAAVVVRFVNVGEQRNETSIHLWRKEDDSVEPLTKGPADGMPVWLDENTLLFTGRQRSDEEKQDKPFPKTRFYSISIRGGEPELRGTLDGQVHDARLSPDGKSLALIYAPNPKGSKDQMKAWEKAPRPVHVTRFPFMLDGVGLLPDEFPGVYHLRLKQGGWDAPKRIISGDPYWYQEVRWLPGSREIIVSRNNPTVQHGVGEILRVSLSGKAAKLNTPGGELGSISVSPSGKHIAFTGNEDRVLGHMQPLALYRRSTDPKDRKFEKLVETEGRMGEMSILSDITVGFGPGTLWESDDVIIARHSIHGRCELVRIATAMRGEYQWLCNNNGVAAGFDSAGGTTLYAWSDPTNPGELYLAGRDKALTRLNRQLRDAFRVKPDRFRAENGKGVQVDTWVWMRDQDRKARKRSLPSILYVHGGPSVQTGDSPMHEYSWLAEQGIPVITSNPRGSTGYGGKHGAGIYGNWGEADISDLLAVRAEALRRNPQLDPRRMAIVGGSYGGYMTLMMVTRHPGLFVCGISERCVSNFVSFTGTSDFPHAFAPLVLGIRHLWENWQRAWELSPLSKLDQVREPLLVIHSDNDWRCPIGQGQEVVAGLVSLGKKLGEDLRFLVFRGESHGLSRGGKPENRRVRLEEIRGWVATHAKAATPRAPKKKAPGKKPGVPRKKATARPSPRKPAPTRRKKR